MTDINGKTAFITGGATGIGYAIARAMAKRGARIMLADIDKETLNQAEAKLAAEGADVASIICDVADAGAVRAAADATLAHFEKVHILVNNAGVGSGGTPGAIPLEDWRWIVDINLMGVVYGVETFAPLIQSHGEGGHIVNTASMAGHIAAPGMGPYNATKFAVVGYSETLRAELPAQNIGVSVLCPAWVRTGIHTSSLNRPSGGATTDDPQFKAMEQVIQSGLPAELVGEYTAECVEADRFYIFTHPDARAILNMRYDMLQADYDACANDPRFADAKMPIPEV